MSNYFVPYLGRRPAPALINGHKLLIMAQEESVFDEQLGLIGADRVKRVRVSENREEQELSLIHI